MDDPNITMEEYIKLEEEKARRRGKVYNWETATYGKIWDDENVHDLRSVETEFPAIVFNDTLTSEVAHSCEPTVSPLNDKQIDFRISFDESDDEDCTVIYEKNSFFYKIIYIDDLKTDSENDNDKVNMPSFPSLEPTVSYFNDLDFFKDFENEFPVIVYNDALTSKLDFLTEPVVSPQHIYEFDLKDETLLSECDEEEQNVLDFNNLFPFNVIYPDDSKSDKENDDDKIDIKQSSGGNVINTDVGAYAQGSNKLLETSHDTSINDKVEMPKIKTVRMSEPIIEEWESDSEDDEIVVKPKEVKPVWNNSKRVNHQNFGRFSHPNPKSNIVPQEVLTKSGLVSLNTAKSVSTAQSRKTINDALPTTYSYYKAYLSVKRPFNKKTTNYNRYFNKRVNTVKSTRVNTARPKAEVNTVKASASWVWKPKHEELDHVFKSNSASKTLTRYDYVDACINEELAEYINTPSWNLPTSSYDDDDDEYSFATQEYLMTCSTIIRPDSPKTDSLIMVDKHLDTIPETESDEFIKSSVENVVQNPSESEDECECDVPDCDDSQTIKFSTFSNPLFDDSTSSNDESSHEEVIHEMSFKTYSSPLFDLDEEIISSELIDSNEDTILLENDRFDIESYLLELLLNHDTLMASSPKIDSLFDEFAGELITIPPRIVNREHKEYISLLERLLYDNSSPRPPKDFHAIPNTIIESLPTFPIPVEDNDSIPPGIESDDYDSEGDDNSTSLPEFKSFHVDYPDSED
ncbi:hypothetical protein Tco_0327000 [Tanacetum coccineum]